MFWPFSNRSRSSSLSLTSDETRSSGTDGRSRGSTWRQAAVDLRRSSSNLYLDQINSTMTGQTTDTHTDNRHTRDRDDNTGQRQDTQRGHHCDDGHHTGHHTGHLHTTQLRLQQEQKCQAITKGHLHTQHR